MAIRTRWFDDQLLAALGRDIVPAAVVPSALRGVPAAAGGAEAGSSAVAEAEGPYVVGGASGRNGTAAEPPRQVVLLGAGMDSRPWRLDLPEGACRRSALGGGEEKATPGMRPAQQNA